MVLIALLKAVLLTSLSVAPLLENAIGTESVVNKSAFRTLKINLKLKCVRDGYVLKNDKGVTQTQ